MMSAPVARTSSGFIAFTVAAVPTGMNAGVRITPLAIAIAPVRALPSVAEMLNEKRAMRGALRDIRRARQSQAIGSGPQPPPGAEDPRHDCHADQQEGQRKAGRPQDVHI